MASHNFALRTWIIEHIGPDMDPDWDPEAVAADTLAVLTLEPSQASTAAADRQHLSIEQIGELRRHKNLTAHLAMLVGHLRPGPARDQVVRWIEVSKHMS